MSARAVRWASIPPPVFPFGYTMNRMGPGLLMNERGQALVDAAYLSLGYKNKDGECGYADAARLPTAHRPRRADRVVRPLHLDHRRGSVPRRQRVAGGSRAAGNMAGLVTGVQYVAMLVAGLFGGVLFDRWRPDRAMIGSRAWSAAFALLPVVGFYFSGLSITLLIISSVGLASLRMVFSPALQSTIPTLVRDRDASRRSTGCSTPPTASPACSSDGGGPAAHLPAVIHFLTATALGFLVSGWRSMPHAIG